MAIPPGAVATYKQIAKAIGHPQAARAVGAACAANPIAVLIPCHRVLRETGALSGYAFGLDRKRALIAWEDVRASSPVDSRAENALSA
jgi:AraC family transcriptional regulator of adaptative response/methylated-DNA-[protein]-cysteine methyltransferase